MTPVRSLLAAPVAVRAAPPRRCEAMPAAGALYNVADSFSGAGHDVPAIQPAQLRRSATGSWKGGDGREHAAAAAESATAQPNHSTAGGSSPVGPEPGRAAVVPGTFQG